MHYRKNGSSNKPRPPAELLGFTEMDDDFLDGIRAEQVRLNDLETAIVGVIVRMAWNFFQIKPGSTKKIKWPKGVYALGFKQPKPRQLRAVGEAFGGEDGAVAPDVAPFLPGRLSKLVQLAKLDPEQRHDLMTRIDCRKVTVKAVTAAVDAALGIAPRPRSAVVNPDGARAAEARVDPPLRS